jgi:hypothetical protein
LKQIYAIIEKVFRGVNRDQAAILLLFVLSAALFVPIVYLGIPQNYDFGQHLRFARTWHDAIASGAFIPSWGAADNAGFGSVGIRSYPPLTHFVMGAVQFLTGTWYDTVWTTMLFWMWIGSVGVFKLASEWSNRSVAFGSAVLYIVVPYHLLQVFQAFLLAEFTAAAILPFCFLYAYRLVTKGGTANIVLFFVAYSALVLAHIPTTIIGTLSLAVFVAGFLSWENLFRTIGRFALAFMMTLAATAFFWVRMVSELSWVKHNTPEYYASGAYNYAVYFFPMIYSSGEVYWARFLWLFDITILVTFGLLITALIVVIKRRFDAPRHLISLLLVGGLALFMMSILSFPLWNGITFVQKLQFPYRWLAPASLVAALLFPLGAAALAEGRKVITRPFAYSLASILTVLIMFDVSQIVVPSAPVPREEIAKAIEKLDKEPACECWWPVWATPKSLNDSQKVTANGRLVTIDEWTPIERKFTVGPGQTQTARIATFYYPHWKAEINGEDATLSAANDGSIYIPLSAEESFIRLYFVEPDRVVLSRYVSAAIAIIWMIAFLYIQVRKRILGAEHD